MNKEYNSNNYHNVDIFYNCHQNGKNRMIKQWAQNKCMVVNVICFYYYSPDFGMIFKNPREFYYNNKHLGPLNFFYVSQLFIVNLVKIHGTVK